MSEFPKYVYHYKVRYNGSSPAAVEHDSGILELSYRIDSYESYEAALKEMVDDIDPEELVVDSLTFLHEGVFFSEEP